MRVDRDVNVNQRMPGDIAGAFVPPVGGGNGAAAAGASRGTLPPPTIAEASRLGLVDKTAKDASAEFHPLRREVRAEVANMLRDGSFLVGLEAALQRQQRQDEQAATDRRYTGEKLGGAGTAGNSKHRFAEFVADLDLELARTMDLIGGLESRLSFLTYDGPSPSTDAHTQPRAAETNRPSPANTLEQWLVERTAKAAAVRHRLELLHEALRT